MMRNGASKAAKPVQTAVTGTQQRYARLATQTGSDSECSWDSIPAATLKLFASAVAANGEALMLSTTRAGGMSFSIYGDGDPIKVYSNDIDRMIAKIEEATEAALASLPTAVMEKITGRANV